MFLAACPQLNLVTMSLSAKHKLAVKTFLGKVAPKVKDIGSDALASRLWAAVSA